MSRSRTGIHHTVVGCRTAAGRFRSLTTAPVDAGLLASACSGTDAGSVGETQPAADSSKPTTGGASTGANTAARDDGQASTTRDPEDGYLATDTAEPTDSGPSNTGSTDSGSGGEDGGEIQLRIQHRPDAATTAVASGLPGVPNFSTPGGL